MRATFDLIDADEMKAEMRLTMTLGQWKLLKKQIEKDKWPASDVASSITSLVLAAEKHFAETID